MHGMRQTLFAVCACLIAAGTPAKQPPREHLGPLPKDGLVAPTGPDPVGFAWGYEGVGAPDWQAPSSAPHEGDFEPVDPAEQRPQLMPPPRPAERAGGAWVARGPAPTQSGQVTVPPDNEVTGAVNMIAAHPVNPEILYIATVNGGVWKTINATAAQPAWTPLTDQLPSQSIGSIALDPLDIGRQTIIAGTARTSSFGERGDDEIGVYHSTNGGASWAVLGSAPLLGQKLIGVAARGPILMASSRGGGLYRSTNTGASFALVSGTGGLPLGGVLDLVGDRSNNSRFYVSVAGANPKVLRSDDNGANWTDITSGLTALSSATNHLRMSVGANGVLYLATVNGGVIARLSRSNNQGASWTAMDVPAIHSGSFGHYFTAMAADPNNENLVYLGGDSIAVAPFTGNLWRGNATLAAGSQFSSITGAGAGNTTPHADSRGLAFDVNGALLLACDGGIYRRSAPTSAAGTWGSVIGNLAITEVHDVDHDAVSNVYMIGTQDNGTHRQISSASSRWVMSFGGDGGDVGIDDTTLGAAGSYSYFSGQNLFGFMRIQFNASNIFVLNTTMPQIPDTQFVTPFEINVVDRNRMLVGGANNIYESNSLTTPSPQLVNLGPPGTNRNAIAFGAAGDASAAYVGKDAVVYRRQVNAFVATGTLPAGVNTITDVAMDPDDSQRVFAIDDNQVFRSINGGSSWQDVTGNLPGISAQDFHTIEYIPDAVGDLVAVGSRSGVFSAPVASSTWSRVGSGLPDVLVFDMRYVRATRVLMVGTLGRGVWTTSIDIVNTAPVFTPGPALTRQQGSLPGPAAQIGTVTDVESGGGGVSVVAVAGGSATGMTVGTIVNNNGSISAPISAGCTATPGTLRFQASDGSLSHTIDLQVNVTANTPPNLSYANSSIGLAAAATINPVSGPSDNGSVLTSALQSQGSYAGTISLNNQTAVISLSNAAPAGTHTITVRTADNCFVTTDASFQLTVSAAPNTAPSFVPVALVTRQQGSTPGAAVTVGTVADAQTSAGSLTVAQIGGGSSTGVGATSISNTNGTVSAVVTAACTATAGTLRFQASDGSLNGIGDLPIAITANSPPVLSYANASVAANGALSINPLTGPSDNGSILTTLLQSAGSYTGSISVNNQTGVITLANAAPVGTHTISIQTADNCFQVTTTNFSLTVLGPLFVNGFE